MKYLLLLLFSLNCFAIDLTEERKLATSQSATTFSSIWIDLNQYRGISISAVISSSAAISGSLKLQKSNDFTTQGAIANYLDISGSAQSVTGNAVFMWDLVDPYYRWVRLQYLPISGSGVLDSNFNIKDFVNEK